MAQLEIYFDDLIPETKLEVEWLYGLEPGEDNNWEVSPLAILEYEDDTDS